ncbi:MAG TPA: protein kinase [Thermoanaerobaculia bacterium]|nr:protein kinase [Thermoanaerobaculia bacterium]
MIGAGAKFGPYEILAPLGAGGMGEVYRARDPRLGREVALKVLPEEVSKDRDRLARFEQEARSASALNHPNIVTIYEVGQSGEISYIAMELVDGKTLRELIISGPLPVRRVLAIGAQAAEGLAKAHAAGIVHRDLKPENLMVTKDGYVKILDFGLSKLAAPESGELSAMPTLARPETQPGTILGTVAYMSPEQASGQSLDYRSDQFSLGSVLYEAVSGEKAFLRKTAAETMSAIIRDEPEPLGKLRPEVPPPLRWIVERCLAKDPDERYASTRDLARDLAGVRDHISEVSGGVEALVAAPAPTGQRLRPLLLAAGILAAGIAVGALAVKGLSKPPARAPSFHRLTFRRGEIANARFAPDGQTILYGARWTGEPNRMYLTRPDSPESRPFDFPLADILAISSSGEMAILLGAAPVGVLARVPMTGGAPREVLEGVFYAGADWAPDGKDLVIAHQVGNRTRLEYPIGKVILESREEDFLAPRFSPGGDQIAFYQEDGRGNASLAVVKTSGKEKETLWGGFGEVTGAPCWSPDGREIWVSATQPGESPALSAIDLTGRRRLVARVPGALELDDISRDGRALAAHHTTVQILNGLAPGEEKERDLSWLDGSIPADLSPDGKTLVFTETAEGSGGRPVAYLRRTDGSPALRLGEGTAIALSPDGKTVLAWIHSANGKPHLVLLPTGAGETRTLQNESLETFGGGGAWLPDGKRVVFTATEKGHRPRVYIEDIDKGAARPITPEGTMIRIATNPVSPDGKLIFGLNSAGKASLHAIEGGEALPIAGLEAGEIPVQWDSDGRSLYVHKRGGVPNKIWLLDPSSGARRPWRDISPPESVTTIGRLLIARDGKSYAYGVQRVLSELYLIEGLR